MNDESESEHSDDDELEELFLFLELFGLSFFIGIFLKSSLKCSFFLFCNICSDFSKTTSLNESVDLSFILGDNEILSIFFSKNKFFVIISHLLFSIISSIDVLISSFTSISEFL